MFFIGLTILSNFTKVSSLSCIQMNNQPCKARPEIINVSSNNPVPVFILLALKWVNSGYGTGFTGNCNNINDLSAKICVSDVVKDLNVKVFNLISRTNETRHIK